MKTKDRVGISHVNVSMLLILLLGTFLRFDRLSSLMTFFGDQAWFYLSARNMILTGKIPLVGITSSHTWLHQGPLWTYLLAGSLFISNFNPVSGVILTSFLGVLSIILVYKIGNEFVSKEFGLMSALIYATSPLIVIHSRMAYHTSPISLLVLGLIYATLKWVNGEVRYFSFVALCFALLYNFELATAVFIPVVMLILAYGLYKKEKWATNLYNKKIIVFSIVFLTIPMIPILIYDFYNGFPQTIKYAGWFIYKILQLVGIGHIEPSPFTFKDVVVFFFQKYSLLVFPLSIMASFVIFVLSLGVTGKEVLSKKVSSVGIIFLMTTVPLFGFFVEKTTSEAYLPMIFPGLIFCFAYLLWSLFKNNTPLLIMTVFLVSMINFCFICGKDYLINKPNGYGVPITERIDAVRKVQKDAGNKKFEFIVGKGQFKTSISPYQYLSWWLGRPDSKNADKKYVIYEYPTNLRIIKLK